MHDKRTRLYQQSPICRVLRHMRLVQLASLLDPSRTPSLVVIAPQPSLWVPIPVPLAVEQLHKVGAKATFYHYPRVFSLFYPYSISFPSCLTCPPRKCKTHHHLRSPAVCQLPHAEVRTGV